MNDTLTREQVLAIMNRPILNGTELRDAYNELLAHDAAHRARIAELEGMTHCRDCCCARAWEALGVRTYSGLSIVEHITRLRQQLDTVTAERDQVKARLSDRIEPTVPMIPIDCKRFEQAPCYLCGYNKGDYYQPDTHPCAEQYHLSLKEAKR